MYKVMVVDDTEVVRRQIKRLNIWGEESGFAINAEAEDGYDALLKLRCSRAELVITDIRMPKFDGLELLRKITENNLADCVIVLSDYTEFEYARKGLKYGAFDYLIKPVKAEELKPVLKKAYEFIFEQHQQDKFIRQLEDKLSEKADMLFPSSDVHDVVELIISGDDKISEAAEKLVDSIAAACTNDVTRTAVVLQRVLRELREEVDKSFPWLKKYADLKLLLYVDTARLADITHIKARVVEKIKELTENIRKFDLSGEKNGLVKQVCRYVLDNAESRISMDAISEALYLTKSHISEIFKQRTGMTIGEYITIVKLERTKMLLKQGQLKNYEIADVLNYSDVEYFSKLFKKYEGITPAEYRKSLFLHKTL